jgi:GNAT superfamily N-acetyltransferase
MTFVVRRIKPDEVEVFKQTRLAALLDTPSAFGSTYEREVAFLDAEWVSRAAMSASGRERAMFFASDAGEAIGLVGGYRSPDPMQLAELISMWTAPSARRRGVGRALVAALIEWATATGAETVALWVTIGNEPAESFYASLGFEPTGEEQPIGPGRSEDEARMALRIGRESAEGEGEV